ADQDWGAQQGPFVVGDTVEISESAAVDQSVLPACELGQATIQETGQDPEPLGSHYEATLGQTNHYVITNYVDCNQALTLIKAVNNDYDADLFPSDWSLTPSAWDGKLLATGDDGELVFDSSETKTVRAGTYQLSEDDVDGYAFDSLTCEGAELGEDDTIEVGLGQNVTCTFTNVIAPGSVEWGKVGGDDAGFLGGSKWNLTGPGGIDEEIVDSPGSPGEFFIEGLAWGTYTLTEVKAPAGYKITVDPITFEVTGDALVFDFGKIVNEQRDGPDLPLTGGFGRDHIYIAGALAVLLGMSAYFYAIRRRKA
ncbi:MAG TPA: SpaA isopeptide-forming pilin-related protein, partial [Beutenbergiaceae bacterium]|nr:SpaA isopeptide-forming pilin-related protein [Beutenbergiaceae bacterium]